MDRITSFMLMLCVAVSAGNAILELRKYSYGGDTLDKCGALHHEGYHGDGSSDVELDDSSVRTYMVVSPPNCPFHFTEGLEFSLSRCSTNELQKHLNYFVMTTAPGSIWPENGFCQASTNTVFRGFSHYKLSVLLYLIGEDEAHKGHPGVIFNAKDYQNYDVIYFRPHSAPGCYLTGHVSQGEFHGGASSSCPAGPPKGRTWFLVEVYVQQGRADVYLDGRYVTEMQTHYGLGGHVGVIVANGFNNTVHFKDLLVQVPRAAISSN